MGETSSHEAHRREAADRAKRRAIRCAVLTVSDTRTPATDKGGDLVQRLLEEAGHAVAARDLVRDEPDMIRQRLEQWLANPDIDVVITTGGTGIARRDTTIEVVRGLLTAELEGFGELFRMISFQRIGAAAMLSRAVGGLVAGPPGGDGDTFIFALPGSPSAVQTAMTELIAPQLAHLVWERGR
jgi:molybdenum cofactor biosynthesis protein B